jgi:hypothetical protein
MELCSGDTMNLELRDELAARVASGLFSSTTDARELAIRAYAIADAMLRERVYDYEQRHDSQIPEAVDPRLVDAPYDPSWELEPRWSAADIARRDATVARGQGPGLARTQSTETEKKKDAV